MYNLAGALGLVAERTGRTEPLDEAIDAAAGAVELFRAAGHAPHLAAAEARLAWLDGLGGSAGAPV